MDRRPRDVACQCDDPPERLTTALLALPWVHSATARLREHGRAFVGEVYVVPVDEASPLKRIEQAGALARALDWRLTDVTVQLVPALTRATSDEDDCEP